MSFIETDLHSIFNKIQKNPNVLSTQRDIATTMLKLLVEKNPSLQKMVDKVLPKSMTRRRTRRRTRGGTRGGTRIRSKRGGSLSFKKPNVLLSNDCNMCCDALYLMGMDKNGASPCHERDTYEDCLKKFIEKSNKHMKHCENNCKTSNGPNIGNVAAFVNNKLVTDNMEKDFVDMIVMGLIKTYHEEIKDSLRDIPDQASEAKQYYSAANKIQRTVNPNEPTQLFDAFDKKLKNIIDRSIRERAKDIKKDGRKVFQNAVSITDDWQKYGKQNTKNKIFKDENLDEVQENINMAKWMNARQLMIAATLFIGQQQTLMDEYDIKWGLLLQVIYHLFTVINMMTLMTAATKKGYSNGMENAIFYITMILVMLPFIPSFQKILIGMTGLDNLGMSPENYTTFQGDYYQHPFLNVLRQPSQMQQPQTETQNGGSFTSFFGKATSLAKTVAKTATKTMGVVAGSSFLVSINAVLILARDITENAIEYENVLCMALCIIISILNNQMLVHQVGRQGIIQARANKAVELKWNDISKYFTDISRKWNDKFPGISQEELISRLVKTAQIQRDTIENTVRLGLNAKSVSIQEKQLGIQAKQLDIQEKQLGIKEKKSTNLQKRCDSVPIQDIRLNSEFPDVPRSPPKLPSSPTKEYGLNELQKRLNALTGRDPRQKKKPIASF